MSYTIQQVSKMTRIPATTLRYYDKEGLLPFLERTESGYRRFSDVDLASLQIVQCLKSARLSIEEIRQFSEWVHEGDSTLQKRLDLFLRRKEEMEKQIRGMEENPRRHQLQMRVLPESCRSRNGKASLRQGQTAPRR